MTITFKELLKTLSNFNGEMDNTLIVLKQDGIKTSIEKISIDEPPSLKQLQQMVGGYIQTVPKKDLWESTDFLFIVNEEGKLKNLDFNANAYRLFGQHIYGNMVIMKERYLK